MYFKVFVVLNIICHLSLSKRICSDICGRAEEELDSPKSEENEANKADESVRIVNGWNAKPRPWMVLIRAINREDKTDYETCGGAIINRKFVITAGHCVCLASSRLIPCSEGKLEYDPSEVLRLYAGLNDANINRAIPRNRKFFEHIPERVIIHPHWTGDGLNYPDLALIQSSKPFNFFQTGKTSILPICIPCTDEIKIEGQDGYVAGWGLTRNLDCFTDNYGPERHVKCRFPFIYQGLEVNTCLKAESPSSKNRKCMQFEKSMGTTKMPKEGQSIMIKYGRRNRRTICYSKKPGNHGWCGVCVRGAKFGEYGFCSDYYPPTEDTELITVVRPSKHWGFCSKLCEKQDLTAVKLQETRLTVLKETECAALNSTLLLYQNRIEFCAGKKLDYPDLKIYKRYRIRNKKRGKKYFFKHLATKKNSLGAPKHHYKLGFYLGESDSCQGDSGGPFYMFKGGKAFLVGVVSRGGQCAGFNQPGIYTNILNKQWRKWIFKYVKDC